MTYMIVKHVTLLNRKDWFCLPHWDRHESENYLPFCLVTKLRHLSWHLPWASHEVSTDPCSLLPLSTSWHTDHCWQAHSVISCSLVSLAIFFSLLFLVADFPLLALYICQAWWEQWFIPVCHSSVSFPCSKFFFLMFSISFRIFTPLILWSPSIVFITFYFISFYHSLVYYAQTFLYSHLFCIYILLFTIIIPLYPFFPLFPSLGTV